MAGWKDFAFEWRERGSAYPVATAAHIAIYGDDTHTLYTIDASGVAANHHMGHLEVVAGATSWRGDPTNEAWGEGVLVNVTTGQYNTGIGTTALFSNTEGGTNTACGAEALYSNTIGYSNTAIGQVALVSNTEGIFNTATGAASLFSNTIGRYNTAYGYASLRENTEGQDNTATGFEALTSSITGCDNTAYGYMSLHNSMHGSGNVAIGSYSGYFETGSNKLYITNAPGYASDALIYGEFDTKRLYVNGALDVMQTMTISGNAPVTVVPVPPTSSSTGAPNNIAYNTTHLYICIASNSWKRITLDSF
jgi:hypothetical protein